MNKRIATLLILTAIIAASFMLFAPAYGQEGVATAKPAQEQAAPTITQDAPVAGISRDALQKYAGGEIVTQTVNGIEMSVSNFRIEDNFLKINVCFTAPDNKDWTIGEGTAQIGNDELLLRGVKSLEISQTLDSGQGQITLFSGRNINTQKTDNSVPNYRCDTLRFGIEKEQISYVGTISLTVKYINVLPGEGQWCVNAERIQSILDEKGLGIKFSCTPTFSSGLASADIEILEKPQGMSEEEARRHISEAYRQAITIDGPWAFEGTVTTTP